MKQLPTIVLSSALLFLCGCGGAPKQNGTAVQNGTLQGPIPTATIQAPNVTGNWQFLTVSGRQAEALTIAGSMKAAGTDVTGAVHVNSLSGSCFDYKTTTGLAGVATASGITLAPTPVSGQPAITLTGSFTDTAFVGTYVVQGVCSDQGSVTGIKLGSITGQMDGTFTSTGKEPFSMVVQLTQGSANPDGSFGLNGTAAFNSPCFTSGTITSGTGSFMLGTSVSMEIDTPEGTIRFLGTADQISGQIGQIKGDYTVTGSCNQTGTLVLAFRNPWDY